VQTGPIDTMTSDVYAAWTALPDSDLTIDKIKSLLGTINNEELWTAAACLDRVVDDKDVQRTLCDIALEKTAHAVQRCKDAALSPSSDESSSTPVKYDEELLTAHFRAVPADAQLCFIRVVMLHRLERLNTFLEIQREATAASSSGSKEPEEEPDPWDDDDDPWADGGLPDAEADMVKEPVQNTWTLSEFLTSRLVDVACNMATQQQLSELRILLSRHPDVLWPFRLEILDSIPYHTPPSDFHDLLPSFDIDQNAEPAAPVSVVGLEDWILSPIVLSALKAVGYALEEDVDYANITENEGALLQPLTAAELKDWYEKRVEYVFTSTGIVDLALATIQHGASQGILGLDEIGEDLSLLSRLVYDATNAVHSDDDWTLSKWRSSEPSQIVSAYLKRSTPSSVARDIPKLVMPYLFVLESRAERSGNPDPSLSKRLLFEYILSAPLKTVEAIFEASKPTLPAGQRIIKNDEDMVRIALACLYGSSSLSEWSSMSRIFECLPAWDTDRAGDAEDEADATIVSLGAFVTPSTDRPQCTPSDLLLFFNPLPINSLSRALDILDVHLESGEILARWNVPAPLRWFLQSSGDVNEQRAWATRMARRAGQGMEKQEEWHRLLHDMLKLGGSGENGLRGAFGLLGRIDILQIFFNGLLTSGSKSFQFVWKCAVIQLDDRVQNCQGAAQNL
jgi:neuroblastoma-amplified sequence